MRVKQDKGDHEPDLVRRYLDEIGSVPLLTAVQEVTLGVDPRGGEVRLHQGLQVLHLRDLVDPAEPGTRQRVAVPRDPAAGTRGGGTDANRTHRHRDPDGRTPQRELAEETLTGASPKP
jgi:hypothetical protein